MSKIEIVMRRVSDDGVLEAEAKIQYLSEYLFTSYPEYREAAFAQAGRLLCRKLGYGDE